MSEHPDVVDLLVAKTPFDAQVVAGVLREAGIKTFVAGQLLTDPVAISETLANTREVRIQVPADKLAAARDAMRAADNASHLLDDPGFDPGPKSDGV